MMQVELHGKYALRWPVAFVDDRDYAEVSAFRWFVRYVPQKGDRQQDQGPYAVKSLPGNRQISMHQFLTGWAMTDHIDHDGLNNQRSNLRPATKAQNLTNSRPRVGYSSSYKGVYWSRTARKWTAQIKIDRKSTHLGYYADEKEAAMAYDRAARQVFGEYAYLNFPELVAA